MDNVNVIAQPTNVIMTAVNTAAVTKNVSLLTYLNSDSCQMRVGGITLSLRLPDAIALGLIDETLVGTATNFSELSDDAFDVLAENAAKIEFACTVESYDNRTIPVYGSDTEKSEVVVYNVKVSIDGGKEISKQVKVSDKLTAIQLASNLIVGSKAKFVVRCAKKGGNLSSNIAWSALKLV